MYHVLRPLWSQRRVEVEESDGSIRIVTAHLISRIPHIPDKTREMDWFDYSNTEL